MKQILLLTDFSPESLRAFEKAKELAALFGTDNSKIYLVFVLEDPLISLGAQFEFSGLYLDVARLEQDAYEYASKKIEEIRQQYLSDLSTETKILRATRPIHLEILEFARNNAIDLIVMSTHGRTGMKHLLLGSVTERVVREAPCPVLVIPPLRS